MYITSTNFVQENYKNMNRLLSILVTLFVLFLVYLWINHLTNSPEQQTNSDQTMLSSPAGTDTQAEDTYTTKESDQPSGSSEESEPVATTPDDDTPEPAAPVTEPPSNPTPVSTPVAPAPKTVSKPLEHTGGVHLVIAGNFLERANAEERVKELKKLGYPQAEVVNFELSEYHTACAGRYSDLNEARRVARKIKEMHGIDTYVRLGN